MTGQITTIITRVTLPLMALALTIVTTGCPNVPKPDQVEIGGQCPVPGSPCTINGKVIWKKKDKSQVQNELSSNDTDIQDVWTAFAPDPNGNPQTTITVTTDTGYTASATFDAVYDAAKSSVYAPVDSQTAPRAYVPRDPQAVKDFINAAVANASSTVDVTFDHVRPVVQVDPSATGTQTNHLRAETSGGIDFYASYDFSAAAPDTGGGDCTAGRFGMLCQ